MKIDYGLLSKSQVFYREYGFKEIDAPWFVNEDVVRHTFNPKELPQRSKVDTDEYLVGSGEQSLISLRLNKKILDGKYQTITPCFRPNDYKDEFHQEQFMKNELIIFDKNLSIKELEGIVGISYGFFKTVEEAENLEVLKTSDVSFDILLHGVEIGSYSLQEYKELKWICGTGLAEPRFSQIREKFDRYKTMSRKLNHNCTIDYNRVKRTHMNLYNRHI